nr:Calx-beta domain-containing protein [uncultured Draconibacterium sp.]
MKNLYKRFIIFLVILISFLEYGQYIYASTEQKEQSEVVFIFTSVVDYQTLVEGISNQAEVQLIDSSLNGVDQMAEFLKGKSGVNAIHIISHGNKGVVNLGAVSLNNSNIDNYADQLLTIGNTLSEAGDILIYGCNVASGSSGNKFIQHLSELTKADVAASNDLTGNVNLGGNWDLEVQTGPLNNNKYLLDKVQKTYNWVLTTTGTADGTYDFGTLGPADSGGSGFKTQGDKFKVSNAFASWGTVIYLESTKTATVVIKAEGGTTMKTATVKDLTVGSAGLTWTVSQFDITLKDYSGSVIATHSLSGSESIGSGTDYKISDFGFSSAWPAAGYDNVAEISITYDLNAVSSNFEFRSITLANIANTASSNTKPTASSFTASPIYENTAYAFSASDFSYSDGDGDPIDQVRITAVPANGSLWVDADGSGTINGAESALSNNGTVSKADLDAGKLKYLNTNGTSSSFTFDVSDGTDYSTSTYTATLTVTPEPTVTLSLDPSSSISENGGSTSVKATLSNTFNKTVTVNLGFSGTASGTDYSKTGSSINITSGNSTGTITLSGDDDDLDENNETVIVDISTITNGAESGTQQVTCTITDDDNTPVVTASQSFSVDEDAANTTSVGTVAATDADAGTTFQSWSITSGNGDGIFAINSATGEITVTDNTNLDYETQTSYSLTVTVSDGTNTSAEETVTVNVNDVTPPVSPVVTSPSGSVIVNSASQTLSGTHTENGVTVHAYADNNNDGVADNTTSLGSSTVSGNSWSFSVSLNSDAANNFVVQAEDGAGNVSSDVDVPTITEDSTDPVSPVVTSPSVSVIVNSASQTLSGTHTENGVTVHAYADNNNDGVADNTTSLGSSTVSGNSWSFSVSLTADAANNFVVQAEDGAGNVSSDVDVPTITEDSTNPVSPVVTSPSVSVIVNSASQTLSGTHTENGVTVHAYADNNNDGIADNTTSLGSSTVSGNSWSFSVSLTADAANNFVVQAEDGAGNVSSDVDVPTITEDSTDPVSPVVTSPSVSVIVNSASQTLSGTHTENGVTVHAYADNNNDGIADNTTSLGSSTVSGNSWSFNVSLTADAANNFVVQAEDGAGNVSSDVDVPTITEDSTDPASPVVTSPSVSVIVNSASQTLSGTHTENGVTVHAYADNNNDGVADNTTSLGSSTVSGNSWSFSVSLTADAANNFVVQAEDGAGNVSSDVDVPTITEDSTDPVSPVVTSPSVSVIVNSASQTLSGTHTENGVTVHAYADNNNDGIADNTTSLGSSTVSGNSWSFSVSLTADAANNFVVQAEDGAGNVSSDVDVPTITEDSTDPVSPVVTSPSVSVIVNSASQTLSGTHTENGVTVHAYADNNNDGVADNTTSLGSSTVSGNSWSFSVSLTADAANNFVVQAEDGAGNVSSDVDVPTITEDSTDPVSPVVTSPSVSVIVNSASQTLSGTHTENGVTVHAYADNNNDGIADNTTSLGSSTVSGNSWSFNVSLTADAANNFVVQAEDGAGNVSSDVDVPTITEDSTDPASPVVTSPSVSVIVNSASQTLSGTHTENGVTVHAYADNNNDGVADNTTSLGSSTVSGNSWSFSVSLTADAANNFVVQAEDGAGNVSSDVDVPTITEDSTDPVSPVVTSPSVSVIVNSASQTLSGTHTENGVTVHAYADNNNDGIADNTTSLGSSTVSGNSWSFSVSLTADAANNFVVQAEDGAGNVSSDVDVPTITEDSTDPVSPVVTSPSVSVIVNSASQTLSGTHTENGVTVHAYADNNNDGVADNTTSLGSSTVSGNSWSFSVSLTADAANNFVVQAEDGAGNVSSDVDVPTITEDSTDPVSPVVTSPSVSVIVNSASQTLSGTHTENGVTVHAYADNNNDGVADNTTSLGSSTVSGNSWSFSVSLTADAANNFVVQAEDGAGNVSSDVDVPTITEDSSRPTLDSSIPADNAPAIVVGNNLTLTFNEAITFGSGTIEIIDLDNGSSTVTIDVTSPGTQASISGKVLTLNPSSDLEYSTNYAVQIEATAIEDLYSNAYSGIADNTTLNFYTEDPVITFSATSSSGAESVPSADLTVEISAVSPRDVTVNYTVGGTATGGGTDYTLADGTLTITAGNLNNVISIADIVDDLLVEVNETVIVSIASPSNASLGTNTTYTYTILDDDNASLTIADVSGNEDDGAVVVTAILDNPVAGGFSVDVSTSDGTATAGVDYFAVSSQTLTFAGTANETKTFTVTPKVDSDPESNETVNITVGNLAATSLAVDITDAAVLTIIDDDASSISIDAPTIAEGSSGNTDLTFTVSLDKAGTAPITVDYSITGGTATSGDDYTILADGTLTFATGETSKTVVISVIGDTNVELNETIELTLTNATGAALIADASGTASITNDDSAAVTIADVAANENDGTVTVTASLNNGVQGGFTVNASTTDGTATTTDSDYTAISGEVLTFAGTVGEIQAFDITLGVDTKLEANETLTVAMSTLAATTLGVDITDQATVTITNDDDASVTIADVSGNEDDGAVTFTATLDNPVDGGFSVDVSTSEGTAIAGVDYFAVSSQTLTFAGTANETKTFTVTPKVDSDPESNETVNITVGNLAATSLAVDITDAAVLTIIDDDASSISIDDPTIAEGSSGNTDLTFTVSLDKAGIAPITVDYATSDGTAEAGSDYTSVSGTLTFASGETSKSVIVPISGDNILEADESFTVTLSNVTGTANLLDGSGTGVIENDDAASVTIADVATDEDNGTVTVTLSLDNGVQGGFTVNASTTDGTATTTDSDYTAISGEVLTFAGTAGETQAFDITLGVDTKLEANETLTVAMSTLAATTLGVDITDQATVTITNDDDASVTIADVSGNEDDGAVTFTATLDTPVDGGFSVDVSTSDGTATAGVDYTALSSQTLTFAGTANETKTFTVTPTVDTDPESNETVNVTFGNLAATSLAVDITDVAVLTIIDDDASSISIDDPTIAEGSSGNTDLTFTVSLDKAGTAPITVDYAITGGTATSGDDYTILADGTLTFAAGETSKTVVISVIGDTNLEPNETIELTLTNATGAALIADASGTATITDDDSAAVTIADVAANEDAGTVTVTASLNNGVQGGFTVNVSTTDGTATTGDSDYTAISGEVLTFAGTAGETQVFDIVIGTDAKLETNETLTVAMSTLAATSLSVDITDQATVTITNDDNASVTIADVSGNEDDGAITVTAVLDNPVAGGFSVDYASADGTATSPDDYTSVSGTLTFAGTVGESQEFTIVPTADLIDEGDETISISLASLSGTVLPVSISDEATITILDDDNTPVITAGQTFSIDETVVNGYEVGTILATDADAGTTLSNWTITEGNGDGIFAINSSTGEITVTDNTNLDYETKTSYSLTVTVSDGTNISAGETVTVNVNNINDNTPVITASQSFNVSEDAANTTSVGTVAATDADLGTTLSDWTITEGNGDGIFAINSSTGEITVTDNTKLDYETSTSYYLTVTVSDGSHTSSSETISIIVNDVFEKSDQNITFSQLADPTYGDSDFNLTATASSGLPVSYSSSNTSVATIDGNTVTIMGAGSTTITASQSGNASYNAAKDAQQGLIIRPKALTIMADDKTKVYDGMVYSPFTVSYAGFVTGEDNTDLGGALTFNGTATTATDVRSDYVITPGGLISDNYAITFVDGTLSITKAAQIITFNEIPLKHLETDPDFNLDATSSSGLAVTYSYSHSSATAPAEVSPTGFVSLLASGEVEITVSQEGDNNYLPAEPVTRTMTIESSDASIHSITINGVTYDSPDQEIYYLIDCNDEKDKVEIDFSTEANATGNTGLNFEIETPTPGIYRKEIQVTSQDNTNTRTYRVVVEKRFNYEDIVIQKYNNVLLVNNNPETNGGYRFTSFNWYKDGVLIGTGQYYSVGDNASDQLDLNAMYSVEMETEDGDILSTCESSITLKSAFVLKIAPNPVHSGSTIDVTTTYSTEMLTDLKITVSNLYGLQVMQEVSGSNNSRITLPSSLTPGTYVISTKAGGVELSTKIIVQ